MRGYYYSEGIKSQSHVFDRRCSQSQGTSHPASPDPVNRFFHRRIFVILYHLLYPLSADFSAFNLFRYITFRTGGAVLTALIISFWLGPRMIVWLKQKQTNGQPIRDDGPSSHLITKVGTPTMGGFLILMALVLSTLLWANITNPYIWLMLTSVIGFGTIGAVDDYLKLSSQSSRGLAIKTKFPLQIILALAVAWWIGLLSDPAQMNGLAIPFFKNVLIDLGGFFVIFAAFVIVGTSNAVNLTDGLDGLAIVPTMIATACFLIIAYLAGNVVFAEYLQIPHVPGTGELAIFCGAMIGASLGFLWFNAPPAMVFMGDTGSLATGAALGTLGVVTKHELVLAIIGGLFVLETLSVIVQVISFKLTGRRVFRMAPLHHHFEKKGWAEPTIVIRFWIIASVLALIGLTTLKLR